MLLQLLDCSLLLLGLVEHLHLREPRLIVLCGETLHEVVHIIYIYTCGILVAQFGKDLCEQHLAAGIVVGDDGVVVNRLQTISQCLVPFFLVHGDLTGRSIDVATVFRHHLCRPLYFQRLIGVCPGLLHIFMSLHQMQPNDGGQ